MMIRIANGRLIDPASGCDEVADLWVSEGRILDSGNLSPGLTPDRVIDATGRIVCPGLVDLAVRLREPGQEHKGSIASETRAAAAGGVTTLCCPPDTDPVLDNPAVAEQIRHRTNRAGFAKVVPVGALTRGLKGEQLSEMQELKEAGCVAVSNAKQPITNTLVMRRAMEYASTLGLTVILNAEDPWLGGSGCMHEGQVSTRLGLPGTSEYAETIAVARELMLIEQTGVRAHFGQLSTARGVEMIAEARDRGLPVTADVSAHQLYLTELDIGFFNAQCHVRPPLRTERDREALRRAVASGRLGAICSDHQPHDRDAKLAPFANTEPGISAVETFLPLVLRLAEEGVLSLSEAIASLTIGPARVLGIEAGTLRPGSAADICIFDPNELWTVREETLVSRGKNTPFAGWEMKGRVSHTLLAGRVVFEREM